MKPTDEDVAAAIDVLARAVIANLADAGADEGGIAYAVQSSWEGRDAATTFYADAVYERALALAPPELPA